MNPTNTTTLNSRITAAQAIPQLHGLKTMMNPPVMRTPTTSGAVLTSDTARSNVNAASDYLNTVNQNAAMQNPPVGGGVMGNTQKDTKKDAIYKTVNSIGADLTDAKVKSSRLKDLSAIEKEQKIYQANVKKIQNQLTQLQGNMDARTSAEIENIKQEYQYLSEEQEQANYQYESGVTTAGFRSGLTRFSPQIQGNIMHNAMSEGVRKLSKLQQDRAKLINEAESARDERNYKMLTTKMDMLRQNFKDQQDTVLRLREELRATDEATRKDIAFKTEAIAPQLEKVLTGDEVQDAEIIDMISKQTGVAPSYILSAYDRYKMDKEKALPASIQEYQAALRMGIVPQGTTYGQWKTIEAQRGSTPKTPIITLPDAVSIGAKSLANKTVDEVINSMTSYDGSFTATPPLWFKETMSAQAGSVLPEGQMQELWGAYVQRPEIQGFIKTGKVESEEALF